ncbi:serine/threonine-protein kinase [Pseudofrankia sp. DC12]|uniref:serine/threonine-protein kinase n=1 Tax=Pseudofrankia sp. DC12 TaxID=683315 RepID=UPI0005F7FCFC|nr:serine/threonine-protein kinase [Pseudofrankia sp. DC12]
MPAIDRARVAAALPRYTLGEQLGSGSFGLVLAGRHLDLDRAAAVKVLPIDDPANGPSLTAAFRAEARMLSRLDHPHIVRIYEYIGQDEFCLLIMELLGGGTLAQHRLPPASACAVGLAVADALSHAHGHGVLHRDIKPDNILFTVAGQPKLTDFGIGRVFVETSGSTSHLAGTPRYMAPEQIIGRHLGPAVDQYSLGVVLYEQLAGRPPFNPGLPVPELLRHHLEEPAPALDGVPAPVEGVVMRALAKDPADRHPDAAAFGHALADAAAAAYGPDWLSLTGLIVRLHESPDVQLPRGRPDSGGHVFRPATARLDEPPAYLTVHPPPDPLTGEAVAADGQARPATSTPDDTGADPATTGARTGWTSTGATRTTADRPERTHPFDGTPFGGRRFGWARLRHWRVLLATVGPVVAVAVAAALVITVGGTGKSGAAPVTTPTASRVTAGGVAGQAAIPVQFSGWAAGPGGVLYFADEASGRIFRRDATGKATVIAGTGIKRTDGDGGPATQASLLGPMGLTIDARGNLYFVDGEGRIRRIDPDGVITTIVGGASSGLAAQPTGPVKATEAATSFLAPDIALDRSTGDLYLADTSHFYRLGTDGVLTPIAHIGTRETPILGGSDPDAALPQLVDGLLGGFAAGDGRLYAADETSHEIKVLDGNGTVSVFAGTGQKGYSGDAGTANQASLNLSSTVVHHTSELALDGSGALYIADTGNYRVRRVDAHGTITTVAGNGPGSLTEGKPAVNEPLYGPDRIALVGDGSFYIENGSEIERVDPAGVIWKVQRL